MTMSNHASHTLFLRWLIFVGVVLAGMIIVWSQGFFSVLFKYDKSYLSLLILMLLIAATVHAGYLIKRLARQLEQAIELRDLLQKNIGAELSISDERINIGELSINMDDVLLQHLRVSELSNYANVNSTNNALLEAIALKLRAPQRNGWMLADMLIKLGLLGTVIGFIFMLYSMESFDAIDISTVQNVLIDMSSGMRVALFTTLAGLTGGIIAGIQYQMADRGADELVATLTEIFALRLSRTGTGNV